MIWRARREAPGVFVRFRTFHGGFLSDFDASLLGVAGTAFGARPRRCTCRRAVGLRVSWWFWSDLVLLAEWRGGLKNLLMRPLFWSHAFRGGFRAIFGAFLRFIVVSNRFRRC